MRIVNKSSGGTGNPLIPAEYAQVLYSWKQAGAWQDL